MYVVEHYRQPVARRLGEANISGNNGFKDLSAEKTAQIGGDLLGKRGSIVVHGEKDAFDREGWVDGTTEAHQSVQKFGDAFESEILALNRNHY